MKTFVDEEENGNEVEVISVVVTCCEVTGDGDESVA